MNIAGNSRGPTGRGGRLLRRIGLIALLVPIAAFLAWYSTRHSISEDRSTFQVLGDPHAAVWEDAGSLRAGLGLLVDPVFLSNAVAPSPVPDPPGVKQFSAVIAYSGAEGTVVKHIEFPPGPWEARSFPLASREIRNIWGSRILRWRCLLDETLSADGKSYFLQLDAVGGGDAGHTVRFDWSYRQDGEKGQEGRALDLAITEQLPSSPARKTRLSFAFTGSGDIELR